MKSVKEIISQLKEKKAKKVLVQLPEGLRTKTTEISEMLEKKGFKAIISVEPCYGACDLMGREAKELGCDVLLHVGHSDFGLKSPVPVVYWEYPVSIDAVKFLKKHMEFLKSFRRIGLVTTIQHAGSIGEMEDFLEKSGKKVFAGKSAKLKKGQMLGCDASAAKKIEPEVDCFLFIGSGLFHPLGLLEKTEKPVLFLNIETGEMKDLSPERGRIRIRKGLMIEKARGFRSFGILVSTKGGQMNIRSAEAIKKRLEKAGKVAVILAANNITPSKLTGIKVGCLINTACPRIAGDYKKFGMIILNPEDVDELLRD